MKHTLEQISSQRDNPELMREMITETAEECVQEAMPWLLDHQDLVRSEYRESLATLINQEAAITGADPCMIFDDFPSWLISSVMFTYGFYRGRTYQDIPDVFKEM